MTRILNLRTGEDFSFRQTIAGHGWYDLPPFELDEIGGSLGVVFLMENKPISARISGGDGGVKIELEENSANPDGILETVKHILRLDDDMSEFYRAIDSEPRLGWIRNYRAGRLLRSPTVFEDLAKTLCTTNCSWSLTRKMVENLVSHLGAASPNGAKAFPTAEAMASVSADFYRDVIRAGYRSPYFLEMAERVAGGEIDPESWLNSELSTANLKREIKQIKGFGNYAAENMLKLLGRYDDLALDSWLRKQFYNKHKKGKPCSDKAIEKFYKPFGKWKGLAIWCDMTESWFSGRSE